MTRPPSEVTVLPWSFEAGSSPASGESLVREVGQWMQDHGGLGMERAVWSVLSDTREGEDTFDLEDIVSRLRRWERYEGLCLMGLGAGGAVFAARDPRLDRDVALKFLWPRAFAHRQRAIQEAQAQARVDHPHVVKIFESGEFLGLTYIAMQRVDGGSLASALPRLDLAARLRLLAQVARGVQAAHDQGVLHLDLKPGNVLVDLRDPDHPWGLVADFGLARSGRGESRGAIGTPPYSSPEQLRQESLSPASDIYALGMCLDALVAERGPFPKDLLGDWPRLAAALPEPLELRAPEVDSRLAALVAQCLAKDPAARPASALAVAEALEAVLAGAVSPASPTLRGRLQRSWGVIAVASLAILGMGAWGWRVRTRAARALVLERQYAQETQDLESQVRFIRTAPRHDVRPELQAIRSRLKAMESRLSSTPQEGQAALHLALGKGYLALRDPEQALPFLQWAWDHGLRSSACAAALGQAHAGIYRDQLETYGLTVSPGLGAARQRTFEVHGRPVLELLRNLSVGPGESQSYLEAQVATCKGNQDADVLRLSRLAQQEAPWLYEAALLEAGAIHGLIMAKQGAGDPAEVARLFTQAEQALDRAAAMGRSDVKVPVVRLALLRERIMRSFELGSIDHEVIRAVDKAVEEARAIEPSSKVDQMELAGAVQIIQGLRREGLDFQARLTRALEVGRHLKTEPRCALRARADLAELLLTEAMERFGRGEDAISALDESDALLRGLIQEWGWTEADLAESHILRCRVMRVLGEDPTPFLQAHLAPFDQALKDYAGDYGAPHSYARAWLECAQAQLSLGKDPAEVLERARPMIALAMQQGGDAPGPRYTAALLHLMDAWRGARRGQDIQAPLREAEQRLSEVLAAQPNRLDAWVLRGFGHRLKGDPSRAQGCLDRVPPGHLLRKVLVYAWGPSAFKPRH